MDESLEDYWDNSNTLLVVANCISMFGKVTGREDNTAQITIIDPVNDYSWDFKFDMPNKEEAFDHKLKNLISSAYTYNVNNLIRPKFYLSNWRESHFKNYFMNGNYYPLEGVYEGDYYKIGVKQGTDGKLYAVYLSGASNTFDWTAGDIKAILEPCATPNVFKAQWFGKWKQEMNFTVIFKDGLMNIYDENKNPEAYIKLYPALLTQQQGQHSNEWFGTGFALKDGYIVTNYHVVENSTSIWVRGIKGDFTQKYKAEIVASDKFNDLSIIKITDTDFSGFGNIPYSISTTIADVGEDIFVLGYPLTSTMGDEIKLTTGVICSRTGFQGDVSLYQISAPIQPGNSGGPLFDGKGNIIGIISAKHVDAENVGYAIKSSYLRNLIESSLSTNILPSSNTVSTLSLPNKVKKEKKFVFFLECSSDTSSNVTISNVENFNSSTKVYYNPTITAKGCNKLNLLSVSLSPESTILELSVNNNMPGGNYQWFSISPKAYLLVNGIKYMLSSTESIALAPNVTYFSYENETKTFRLIFPPIPTRTTSFDFIESTDSEWKLIGVKLRN